MSSGTTIAPKIARILAELENLKSLKVSTFSKSDLVDLYIADVPFLLNLARKAQTEINELKRLEFDLYRRLDVLNEEIQRLRSQASQAEFLKDVFSNPEKDRLKITIEDIQP